MLSDLAFWFKVVDTVLNNPFQNGTKQNLERKRRFEILLIIKKRRFKKKII